MIDKAAKAFLESVKQDQNLETDKQVIAWAMEYLEVFGKDLLDE